jgi:hypothetical protein
MLACRAPPVRRSDRQAGRPTGCLQSLIHSLAKSITHRGQKGFLPNGAGRYRIQKSRLVRRDIKHDVGSGANERRRLFSRRSVLTSGKRKIMWQVPNQTPVRTIIFIQVLALITFVSAASTADSGGIEKNVGFSNLVTWVKKNGGRVDERLGLEKLGEDGIRGAVALSDIEEGVELMHCPWELVIGSTSLSDQMKTEIDMCGVIGAIEKELRLGDSSSWNAYLDLDDSMVNSRLPTLWGDVALNELQNLIPDATRHIQWFAGTCTNGGGSPSDDLDDETKQALFSFITRASAVGMVPIYDLLNHHNGQRNAKLLLTEEGVQLTAVGPIASGGEIFLSYGIKLASTMYRDYGFVESWPQIWTFPGASSSENHAFALFPDGFVAINPTETFLRTNWSSTPHLPLEQLQTNALEHMQQLSPDALRYFQTAAHALLERLPTSLEEDAAILELKTKAYQEDVIENPRTTGDQDGESESINNSNDVISAIQYRMTFKKAVHRAIDASEDVLRQKVSENGSSGEL